MMTLAKDLGALAAAAFVASFIVGWEASMDGDLRLAVLAIAYFGLGGVLGAAGWLVYALRELRRG